MYTIRFSLGDTSRVSVLSLFLCMRSNGDNREGDGTRDL